MHSLINFLGALTARMIGLMGLITTASLCNLWLARAVLPNSTVLQMVATASLVIFGFGLAMIFLSPKATQRLLRRRRTVFGRLLFAIVMLAVVGEILISAFSLVRFIDPRFVAFTGPLAMLSTGLAIAFVLLFLLPGTYARGLAQRHDANVGNPLANAEFQDRSWGEAFADFAGAATARLIGLIVIAHPIVVVSLHIKGTPRPVLHPLGDVTAVLALAVAVVFLVPAATRRIFEPLDNWAARALLGIGWMTVLVLAFVLSAMSLSELAAEPDRDFFMNGLLTLFESQIIFFILLFLVPAYYTRRLPLRAAQRQLGRERMEQAMAANVPGPQGGHDQTFGSGDDWRDRLRSYQTQRAGSGIAHRHQRLQQHPRQRPMPRRSFVVATISFFSTFPILAAAFLAFYGWRIAQFVPTTETVAAAVTLQIPLLIAASILAVISAFTAFPYKSGLMQSATFRLLFMVSFAIGIAWFGSNALITKGLPGVHSFFVDAPTSEITLEVTGIGKERVRRGCNYTVFARGEDYAGPQGVMICEVGRDLWPSLHPRDRITLHGYKTPYGFRYDSVTR